VVSGRPASVVTWSLMLKDRAQRKRNVEKVCIFLTVKSRQWALTEEWQNVPPQMRFR
jgi:hypothetical protein